MYIHICVCVCVHVCMSIGVESGNSLQYPWLKNVLNRGAWHGVSKSWTWLSNWACIFMHIYIYTYVYRQYTTDHTYIFINWYNVTFMFSGPYIVSIPAGLKSSEAQNSPVMFKSAPVQTHPLLILIWQVWDWI